MTRPRPLLLVLLLLALCGCGREGYQERWGKVTWGHRQSGRLVLKKLEGADPSTFEILTKSLARDQNAVYYNGDKVADCSPDSLEVLEKSGFYYRDDGAVWASHKKISQDPDSFELLPHSFSRDSSKVWYLGSELPEVSAPDFEVLQGKGPFGRDNERVYFSKKPLPDADADSITVLDYNHSKDKHRAYFEDKPLPGSDPDSFEAHDSLWARDSQRVYYRDELIEGLDGSTVEFLQGNYVKDANSVFHNNKQVEGADAASFEAYKDKSSWLGRDKNHVYSGARRLENKPTP